MSTSHTTTFVSADRYGVVGDPVAHSKSPEIHREFAATTQQSLTYEKFHVGSDQFAHFVRDFFGHGGKGLNVTLPHKLAAAALADQLTPRAKKAGAVNTLLCNAAGKLIGDNTDGAGLIADLERLGAPIAGARIVIIGAGGAVRGILGPLLDKNPTTVWIANRNVGRAEELIKEFSAHNANNILHTSALSALNKIEPADLLLQATPLGLNASLPNLPATLIGPQTFAYDLAYTDGPTVFESWAVASGARQAASGLGMLIEQAAEAFSVWRGIRPDTTQLHAIQRSSPRMRSNNR